MTSDTTPTAIKTKRIVELDSLRALAAINLVLFHFTHVYAVKYGYTSPLGFEFPFGKYGVQLFFMLSGLVNAMTLLKKRDSVNFLAGRIIRICPSYWSVIAINLLIIGVVPLTALAWTPEQVAANLTIVPNLLGFECLEPVTWTLQVEILFYGVILFLFLTGALKRPLRIVMYLLSLSLVTCLSINYLSGSAHDLLWLRWLETCRELMILEYLPLFTIGILLNEIRNHDGSVWRNGLGILASVVVFHVIDRHDHNPVATLILLVLLAFSAYGRVPFLRFKPLVWVSTISYALYLLHNNLGCVFIWHINQAGVPPVAAFLLGILFVVAVSAIVTFKIERPLTAWLRGRWMSIHQRSRPIETGRTQELLPSVNDSISLFHQHPFVSNNRMIKKSFHTKIITNADEFAACQGRWNELAGDRLFHRWEWMYHWWQAFGSEVQLAVVVIIDANDQWVGIGAWFKTVSASQGCVVRQLASGSACSDYNSLAIRPGYETVVGTLIAEVIAGTTHSGLFANVDLFELEGHLGDDTAIAGITAALPPDGVRCLSEEIGGSWRSRLPETWGEYEQRLHKSFRRKARKANRRLGDPQFRAEILWDASLIGNNWNTFVDLHQRRRESIGESGCFSDPRFERFLASATIALADSGRAQINLLKYQDQPLAANLEFVTNDSVYMYQTGFDPKRIELEPGHLTFTWAIQSSIERGFTYFDFLRGDEPYKSRWKSSRIPLFRTRIVPDRISARLRNGIRNAGRQVRNMTRSLAWSPGRN